MDNGANNGDFGDEMWGADNLKTRFTDCTDATDGTGGSDFTPSELAMLNMRKLSNQAAPLPEGVQDVHWQPPVSTGLENSAAIFATELDAKGEVVVSSEGISESNCHFRSWQEDNGVASTFASMTVEKDVDGQQRTVAVANPTSALASRFVRASATRPSSADVDLRETKSLLDSSVAMTPDFQGVRTLRRCSSAQEHVREDRKPGGKIGDGGPLPEEGAAAGPSLPPVDGASQKDVSQTPQGPSAEAASESTPDCCAQPGGESTTLASGGAVGGRPSSSTTVAPNRMMPPMPRRPSNGVASSHPQEPRPGRSLATQVHIQTH